MTNEEMIFLDKINKYAEEKLGDIDPQKTPVSEQLQVLRPILQELAMAESKPVEEIFIKYMDLASEAAVQREKKYEEALGPNYDFKI